MSYARFGKHSDIYLFAHVGGYVQCCGCWLGDEWNLHSAQEVVQHLEKHVKAGHQVHPALLDPEMYHDKDFEEYQPRRRRR